VIKNSLVTLSKSVNVPVEQAGVLTELLVREGQLVKRGQLIGKLDDSDLLLQIERAETEKRIAVMAAESQIDIEYARKSRDVASADLRRSEQANLRVANTVSVAKIARQTLERDRTMLQLQKAERDYRIAGLKAQLAQKDIDIARSQLRKTQVLSPAGGMVVAVKSEPGEWVEPSQTLITVVRVDRLRVEGFVKAETARLVKVGMPVEVKFKEAWVSDKFTGKIVFVNPEANPHNMTIQIWAEIENTNQVLLPGLRGDIHVQDR
jgi:multidrug resistance efflux pump